MRMLTHSHFLLYKRITLQNFHIILQKYYKGDFNEKTKNMGNY